MKSFNKYNESVRDMMTPKSIEDIKKKLTNPDDLLELFVFGCEKKQGFIIKYALDNGLDIHIEDDAPLRVASRYGCKNTVKYLLEKGANVHAAGDDALMWSFELDDDYIQKLLFKYGAKIPDTNESVRDMMTPKPSKEIEKTMREKFDKMHIGWYEEYLKVKPLLDEAHEYIQSQGFNTSLEPKIFDFNTGVYGFLFDNDIKNYELEHIKKFSLSYNFVSKKYMLSTYMYNDERHLDIKAFDEIEPWYNRETEKTSLLLKLKSRLNELTKNDKYKIVLESVKDFMTPKPEEEIRKLLESKPPKDKIKYGVLQDIPWLIIQGIEEGNEDVTEDDNFLIKWASERGHLPLVKLLMEKGADIHCDDDRTLLNACYTNNPEMVKFLLDNNANPDADRGYLLSAVAMKGNYDIVELLLKAGANKKIEQAIKMAKNTGHDDILELLKKYIPVNESIRDKMTPKPMDEVRGAISNMTLLDKIKWMIQHGGPNDLFDYKKLIDEFEVCTLIQKKSIVEYAIKAKILRRPVHVDLVTIRELPIVFKEILKFYFYMGESVRDKMTPITDEKKDEIFDGVVDEVIDILVKEWDYHYEENARNWAVNHKYEIVKLLSEGNPLINTVHILIMGWDYEPVDDREETNEGIRDFMTPKSKDEIKKVLDRLPERERIVKGISMEVYDTKDIDDMLDGLSPREYFLRSSMIEKGLPVEKKRLVNKAMTLIKPYKKVKIGDLLTVTTALSAYGEKTDTFSPLYEIVQKITFFSQEEFYKFIKEYQESTKHDVMSDEFIKQLYRTNTWKKVNCVMIVAKNRNRYGSIERKRNTYIIYDYGRTTGVFPYTKKELDEYEQGS